MRGPEKLINAFHPDFVKTHMPEFLTAVKTDNTHAESATNLSKTVTKIRKTKPSHGQLVGISKVQRETEPNQKFQDISAFPKTRKRESMKSLAAGKKMTMAEVAEELKPRGFHTYSKAGTANTTKVKKK
jgi:hypothetical protein